MRPQIYSTSEHEINSRLIDPDALFVIERLKENGYEAYLVGGSVRDLLTNRVPKDYDVSTSAKPEEIKRLFKRQCLLIGRRFRLAHIRFGKKIIEVATFRQGENQDTLITHDNEWGTAEEDVLRRDFTINGLFFDPTHQAVIDYVGGWEDIHKSILRSIGDPVTRFKQDPVRMIRLLKFRARFGFDISDDCKQALLACKKEITKSSPARLQEEILRMLESGSSARFFKLMTDSGLLSLIFPYMASFLHSSYGEKVYRLLDQADLVNRKRGTHPLDRAVLVACLLFPILEQEIKTRMDRGSQQLHLGDIMILSGTIVKDFMTSSCSHFPRRITTSTAYILTMQYRFVPLSGKRHIRTKMMQQNDFYLALNFLKLQSLVDPTLDETYTHCRNLYRQHTEHREHHHPPPQQKDSRGQHEKRRRR